METFKEIMYTIWPVLQALLVLAAAFIVAGIIKSVVLKLLGKEKIAKALNLTLVDIVDGL